MKRILKYLILLVVIALVFIPLERKLLINIEQKVTKLKNEYDLIKNNNNELRKEISTILSVEKLDKIAKENNYFEPKDKDIIYLK